MHFCPSTEQRERDGRWPHGVGGSLHGTQSEEGASKVPRAQMEPQLRHLIAAERTAPAALILSPPPPPPLLPLLHPHPLSAELCAGQPRGLRDQMWSESHRGS